MEISASQALQMYKDKEGELSKLRTRQKKDAALAKRTKFVLTGDDNKPIPKCYNVTLPKAANFASRANAILASANERMVCEGVGLDDNNTSKKETFFNYCLSVLAQQSAPRKIGNIFAFTAGQANLRGSIARRVTVEYDEEKGLKVEILPWDTLFANWDFDSDGLYYAANTSIRSRALLESEYEKVKVSGKTGKIIDFLGKDINHIFIDGAHKLSLPNPRGYVPVAVAYTSAGLPFLDEDMDENLGESIFWQGRDLYDEANRIASVAMTLHVGSLFPPVQKPYDEIPNEKPESPYGGTSTVVPYKVEDGAYTAFPRQDLYQATRFIWSLIDAHIQQSSFSTIEFGTLQFPLSSVALRQLEEGRELVLLPSIQAISEAERQTCEMIKEQFIALGKTVELQGEGKKASYAPKDLEGEYEIFFRYFTGSRKYAAAGISEAQALKPLELVSDDYLRNECIRVENPSEEARKLETQRLERTNPAIQIYNQLKGLVEQERWAEAWIQRKLLRDTVRSLLSVPSQESPDNNGASAEGIPLFTGAPSKVGGRQPGGITAEETKKAAAIQEMSGEEA